MIQGIQDWNPKNESSSNSTLSTVMIGEEKLLIEDYKDEESVEKEFSIFIKEEFVDDVGEYKDDGVDELDGNNIKKTREENRLKGL